MIWSSTNLGNVSFITLLHAKGICSDKVIYNFFQTSCLLAFALYWPQVYKGLLVLWWQIMMPLLPWGVTCHRFPKWHIFPAMVIVDFITKRLPIFVLHLRAHCNCLCTVSLQKTTIGGGLAMNYYHYQLFAGSSSAKKEPWTGSRNKWKSLNWLG